jgi:hypothetical protein
LIKYNNLYLGISSTFEFTIYHDKFAAPNTNPNLNPKGPHRPDAFGNATRIFSFQKQIKPSTDKNFTRYADQIAKVAEEVPNI